MEYLMYFVWAYFYIGATKLALILVSFPAAMRAANALHEEAGGKLFPEVWRRKPLFPCAAVFREVTRYDTAEILVHLVMDRQSKVHARRRVLPVPCQGRSDDGFHHFQKFGRARLRVRGARILYAHAVPVGQTVYRQPKPTVAVPGSIPRIFI